MRSVWVVIISDVLLEHLHSNQIEDRDHISWVVLKLPVQLFVKLEDMAAIYIKGVLLCFSNLFQQGDVVWLLVHVNILSALTIQILIFVGDYGKSCQKIFEF